MQSRVKMFQAIKAQGSARTRGSHLHAVMLARGSIRADWARKVSHPSETSRLGLAVHVARVLQATTLWRVAGVLPHFKLLVVLVNEDDARVIILQLVLAEDAVADDDDQITRADQARSRAVDADDSGATVTSDGIGGQAIAIVDVNNVDLFAFKNVGGFHQIGVDGARANVVQVSLRDGGSVDLGFQHGAQHGCSPYSVPPGFSIQVQPPSCLVSFKFDLIPT